jgi:RecA/RadA recombinase
MSNEYSENDEKNIEEQRIKPKKNSKNKSKENIIEGQTEVKNGSKLSFIHTGSHILNAVVSGKMKGGGWARSRVQNIVGDGGAGKTVAALEMSRNALNLLGTEDGIHPKVESVKIVYNNGENVMDFDIELMYPGLSQKIEWANERIPGTVQAFGRDFAKMAKANEPGELLIYIVDSIDSLRSEEQADRFEKSVKDDSSQDGSYNAEKQKYLSQTLPEFCELTKHKDIMLFTISQVRVNFAKFGPKYTRTGGKWLDFYTHQVPWLAQKAELKKTSKGHERTFGVTVEADMKRSKVCKPYRTCMFDIIFDYGIDDISSLLYFLYGQRPSSFELEDKKYKTKESFIKYIEDNNLENVLIDNAEKLWQEIETNTAPVRKKKF